MQSNRNKDESLSPHRRGLSENASPDGGEGAPAALGDLLQRPKRIGFTALSGFLLVFVVWGGVAPMAGGAVAPGEVSPDGGVRTVQHLEGGIVSVFHVSDGDLVEEGAPLVTLDGVGARSEVAALKDRRVARLAEQARLEAEMQSSERIAFPNELGASAPETARIIQSEERIFSARREMMSVQKRVLRQRVRQLDEEIIGLEAQVESATERLSLIEEELSAKLSLLEKGLSPKTEILRLRRAAAEISGFRGEQRANIAAARRAIGETELQLVALDAERTDETAQRFGEIRNELAEIDTALAKSSDVLSRTTIVAPISGRVSNFRIRTSQGVVQPGEPILDVVPEEEALLVDARVSPTDIDLVMEGLTAQVRLLAYSGRALAPIHGTVTSVSAQTLSDQEDARPYYLARVSVQPEDIDAANVNINLVPGMPADVVVVTEKRTLLEYLVKPIREVMRGALREP